MLLAVHVMDVLDDVYLLYGLVLLVLDMSNLIQVLLAVRFHLFPFRTEKLSSLTPMVLRCNVGE